MPINLFCNPDFGGCDVSCDGVESCLNTSLLVYNAKFMKCNGRRSCCHANSNLMGISSGLSIDCNNNEACMHSTLIANMVEGVTCHANMACGHMRTDIGCNPQSGCKYSCIGTNACYNSVTDISFLTSLYCDGTEACKLSEYTFTCFQSGCKIEFRGNNVAQDSHIKSIQVKELLCFGNEACKGSNIDIICLSKGCDVTCQGK